MASFSELLTKKSRWPMHGDQLFAVAADPLHDARLTSDWYARLHVMTDGYKRAGDLLVERAIEEPRNRDFFVYPAIFCYRHYLELTLKAMLAMYGWGVGIEENWNLHDLKILWNKFEKVLLGYNVNDPDNIDPVVAACILEFSKIDPHSSAFRYPVYKNGKPMLFDRERLDLTHLRDVMDGLYGYFEGTHGYLSDLANY